MNASRVAYLDYARGFAVFTMFLQHSMLMHEFSKGENTPLGIAFVLLGTAPAAPVFLLLMGVFQGRSNANFAQTFKRGLLLIGLGYLLNALRAALPLWLSGESDFPPGESPLENLMTVDILQTAGLSLILCGLLKQYLPKAAWFALALAVLFLAPMLWQELPVISPLNLLWGDAPQIAFPLFPWLFYPIVGMLLSEYLISTRLFQFDAKRTVALFSALSMLCLLLLFTTPIGDYVRSGAGVHLGILLVVYLWLWALYKIEKTSLESSWLASLLSQWSQRVTSIYFIQWLLFGWSALLLGANDKPDHIAALIGFVVLLLTHLLTRIPRIQRLFP